MSNQRVANFAYFLLSVGVLIVTSQLLTQLWGYMSLPDVILVGRFGIPYVVAVVLALTVLLLVRGKTSNDFVLEVISELRAVTWPTRQDTTTKTMVVIVTVIVLSIIMGGFDLLWAKASKFLLNSI